MPAKNHVMKCHIHTVFELLQGWGLHHCPGQPVPMSDHSFSKEIFPNIQSKPPLMQLEAIASRPVASYLGKETNTRLTTPSFQVAVGSDEVSPQPPLLQTKQPQLPQLLLLRLVLQTPHQPPCPSLDTLPAPQCPSCREGPKTEHSIRGTCGDLSWCWPMVP